MIRFSVREISKKYTTINYGGCGLFAKSLHKALTTKGYDVKFVFLSHTKYARNLVNGEIDDFDWINILENGNWFHIVAYVNGKYIDANGVYSDKGDYLTNVRGGRMAFFSKEFGVDLLSELVNTEYGWNPTFKRELIKPIEKKLIKDLVY